MVATGPAPHRLLIGFRFKNKIHTLLHTHSTSFSSFSRTRTVRRMCAAESDDLPSFDLGNYLRQNIYHRINVDFPGLQLVHEEPYIFLVNTFLPLSRNADCSHLSMSPAMLSRRQPVPGQAALRTSTSVFPAETSIRWLRERIAALTNVQLGQLEPTKISMYAKGQYFKKHTDASFLNEKLFAYSARLAEVDEDGVQAPCSWPSRFCTCFIYLNDCAGGRTRFGWLDGAETMPGAGIFEQCINALRSSHQSDGRPATNAATRKELSIPPRTGLAVVHFPTTDLQMGGCVPDPRTMHESETAVDPKCIIQQFIWPCEIDAYAPDLHEDVRREWLGIQASAQGTPSS